jgi:hypothetical protein
METFHRAVRPWESGTILIEFKQELNKKISTTGFIRHPASIETDSKTNA